MATETLGDLVPRDESPRRGSTLAIDFLKALLASKKGHITASDLLGMGVAAGGIPAAENFDALLWANTISSGRLRRAHLDQLREAFALPQADLLEGLHVSARSFQRWKRQADQVIDDGVAERAVELAEVVARAIEVMEGPERADRWLSRPNAALDGKTPMDLAKKPFGVQAVLDQLNAIEHGMFA